MINRQNWHDVKAYLRHLERIRQLDDATVKRSRSHLRHVLEWADSTPLTKARVIDPPLPIYLEGARGDDNNAPLSPASIRKCLSVARGFFTWAAAEHKNRYRAVTESWISMLQPPRHLRSSARLPVRQFYTLDDVLKIASVSTETLRQERAKVAACILFLSGMRSDALASLPISCVDLPGRRIMQLPEFGVRTKNRKAAITHLLNIPELLDVCARWQDQLGSLPADSLWYATLTRDGMQITATRDAYDGRATQINRDLRMICDLAGVAFLSPHKLRHGHVVYALKKARNMAELKAISQNVMHASVTITDQVYGVLANDDVGQIIGSLGQANAQPVARLDDRIDELIRLLRDQ